MLTKPSACSQCSLERIGLGYAPADGPESSPILFVGESLGADEARVGRPFIGAAGGMLQRIFTLLGAWKRDEVRIDNVCRCRPPQDDLSRFPGAIHHCSPYLDASLASTWLKVVVPMGGTAIRRVLGISGKHTGPEDFHGTVTRDPHDRFWVVPTYHPSHLQRGASNLVGTVLWDLTQAQETLTHGKPADPASLVIDPPLEWFTAWVDTVVAARTQDPGAYPISSDVETPDKASGKDEGTLSADDRSYQILRVNVACHPDEGVTVPFQGPFLDQLRRLHQSPGAIWGWNYEYDFPRLRAAEILREVDYPKVYDLMWLWHFLQSDLPRGLGFTAPFYSSWGAWKHLASAEAAKYGAIDALQNHRVGFGVINDLIRQGMWDQALRHIHRLNLVALKPAQAVGVKIDRQRLLLFKADLGEKANVRLEKLQGIVPEELRPLTPKGGLTAPPATNVLHVKATAFTRKGVLRAGRPASEVKQDLYKAATVVQRELQKDVLVCRACGESEVHRKHRCRVSYTKKDGTTGWKPADHDADLQVESRPVTRWFWQEPFNPDSPEQVLAYLKLRGHQPGRAKKTHKATTNRETLDRLQRTGDPFYRTLLDYRAVMKVKGTYVDGTERRLDGDDRIHPEPTFKPSTGRLSYQNPNITNVIQDKGGQESLAAGFRRCVVALPSSRLLEVDFSGSEAVDFGWFMRDPGYIRLAKLGVHAGLATHVLGSPYDPTASDGDLGQYFKSIKESPDPAVHLIYNRSKRFVHGFSYGLTIPGMQLQFPEMFPTRKVAEGYAEIFKAMAPKAMAFQRLVRERAAKQHYLGGPGDHPFGYKHWFWSVYTYKKITEGQYWKSLSLLQKKNIDLADMPLAILNGQHFKVMMGEDGKRCLPPTTQVWMGDYTYKNLGDVCVGDKVIGWIRARSKRAVYYKKAGGQFGTDTLTRATVTAVHNAVDTTLTLRLGSGQTIRCTRDHQWLCLRRHEYVYLRADQLRPNEKICRVDVVDPGDCPVPLKDTAAWLGGFYAGEGSINGVSQAVVPGKGNLLDEAKRAFDRLGFTTIPQRRINRNSPEHWRQAVFLAWTGGRQEALRFLRWVPSYRYRAQWADQMLLSSRFRRLDTVVGIEENTVAEPVVCITTTTGNFVADGLCSHNCVAFYPQSTTAAKLKVCMLRLFDPESPSYIGEAYFGKTPLRAPIHDSLLLEIPTRQFELVASIVVNEMQRPFPELPMPEEWGLGPFLSTGVAAKVGLPGQSWGDMHKLDVAAFTEVGVGSDVVWTGANDTVYGENEDDEIADLGRAIA